MENTTKASVFDLHKTKILRIAALIFCALISGHASVMNGSFPAAVAFIAYMVYRNPVNLYLVIPVAAGILPYVPRGLDPWGDIAAVILCGVTMALAAKARLFLWHAAVISSAISIVCNSVFRILTGTVYKIGPENLIFIAVLIFVLMILMDVFFHICTGKSLQKYSDIQELSVISTVSVCMLVLGGLEIAFMAWPVIMFLALSALAYWDAGRALLVTVTGSIWAALLGQTQWGLLATMAIGIVCAFPFGKMGKYFCGTLFIFICWLLGFVESGLVLGADNYCLILATAVFAAVNWKFGKKMKRVAQVVSQGSKQQETVQGRTDKILKNRALQMEEMAELYSTYFDRRSVLSNQFDIMRQILDDTRRQAAGAMRKKEEGCCEKLQVDISISQCAASGSINGDCCGWQDIGQGKVAMVVSDGMGKGKKAASESLLVTKTIMALLKSGVTVDRTLKMINTVMLIKDDEDSYATVDLAIVDKQSAKVKFYKIGAAPTLIRRKSNVEEVRLSTVPLGIVNGLKIRYMETTLKKDDWIIMMSDGVSDGGGAGSGSREQFLTCLKTAASKIRSSDPKVMSRMLLNHASDSYIGRERDDMTVLAAKIL